jgi:hypothetical protein
MKRNQIINQIIKEKGYQSYLEIGLGNEANFNAVQCQYKKGVDPEGAMKDGKYLGHSDDFFNDNPEKFDLIFIDGDHTAEQVERDIINSWKCLNPGGTIIIHDIKPLDEVCQRVPRETVAWTGNVWRVWYGLKNNYPKLKNSYIDERVGLGVIEKSRHKIEPGFIDWETSYEDYNEMEGWE